MFEEFTFFNCDFLDNLQHLVKEENKKLQDALDLHIEAFNYSNCQCATEHYEFVIERQFKEEFKEGFLIMGMELLVLGLYKQHEVHIKNYVKNQFPELSESKQEDYCKLNKNLNEFVSINELRLINNCIKHEGIVSSALANKYTYWKKGSDLGDLSSVYDRLKYKVKDYVIAHEKYLREIQDRL